MVLIQVAPIVMITFQYGDGNLLQFNENVRTLHEDWNGLYSEFVPYILEHSNRGDLIICVCVIHTGMQYYLDGIELVDIGFDENLAVIKGVTTNESEALSLFTDLGVRYFLFPTRGKGVQILNGLSEISGFPDMLENSEYFSKRMTTNYWQLIEFIGISQE